MADAADQSLPIDHGDRRDFAWYVDRAVLVLVFLGGISAIVFIIGIFVFITKEGAGFVSTGLDVGEFLGSPAWRPTSDQPTYGILALIAGTASVTGLAMLVSVPFSLGAAIPQRVDLRFLRGSGAPRVVDPPSVQAQRQEAESTGPDGHRALRLQASAPHAQDLLSGGQREPCHMHVSGQGAPGPGVGHLGHGTQDVGEKPGRPAVLFLHLPG